MAIGFGGELERATQASNRAITAQVFKSVTVMKTAEFIGLSASEDEDSWAGSSEYALPRFDGRFWMSMIEHSTRLGSAIRAVARSSVGLGCKAIVAPHVQARVKDKRNKSKVAEADVEQTQLLLDMPNQLPMPITEVCSNVEFDVQGSGDGYLEVAEELRDNTSPPVALLHLNSLNVRIHKSRDKFCKRMQNGRYLHYRRFGDINPAHRFINKLTGEWYAVWPADLPPSQRGTALIHFKTYSPLDEYYGKPAHVSALLAVVGNRLAALWNVNFLKNNAHIPFVVIVKNGNLHPDSVEQITLFTEGEAAGANNTGRAIILQPDLSGMANGDIDISIEELRMGVKDDASFEQLKNGNNAEIQEAVGVADIFLAASSATSRATAIAGKQSTFEQTFEPRTITWEHTLSLILCPRIGNGQSAIKFRRTRILDALQTASTVTKFGKSLTYNEIRAQASSTLQDTFEPYTEDWANKPTEIAVLELKAEQAKEAADAQAKLQMDQAKLQAKTAEAAAARAAENPPPAPVGVPQAAGNTPAAKVPPAAPTATTGKARNKPAAKNLSW